MKIGLFNEFKNNSIRLSDVKIGLFKETPYKPFKPTNVKIEKCESMPEEAYIALNQASTMIGNYAKKIQSKISRCSRVNRKL